MAKKNEQKLSSVRLLDAVGFFSALFYMQSVLTVAHHTSLWVHDGTSYTVESPAIALLVVSLFTVFYSAKSAKMKLSTLQVITLTILATSSLFWLSGLRTNFYF